MPSISHETLTLLFQNRAELAPELLREAFGLELPAYAEVRIESADFTDVQPAEYRADLAIVLVDAEGRPVFGIILEVQLARDERKRFTWPTYAASFRARIGCEVVVLVLAPDPHVAVWAAELVRLGPGFHFVPTVLDTESVPAVTDPVRAIADPELAVLSVLTHGRGNVERAMRIAAAAVAGVAQIQDQDRLVLYSDAIDAALSEAARKALHMIPPGYQFQSQLVRDSIAKGVAKGRAEGLTEGRAEGLTEAVLAVLAARSVALTEAERRRIETERDIDRLGRWLRAAVTATDGASLFQD